MQDFYDEHVQAALQLAPVGAYMADMNGNCFFINSEFERIRGLGLEEVRNNGWQHMVIPEDLPGLNNIIATLLKTNGRIFHHTYRVRHPQKGLRYLKNNARIVADNEGHPRYLLGCIQDITDEITRNQRLEDLMESQERLNQLLEISQEISKTGGFEFNLSTGEISWTKQIYAIYGMPDDYIPTFEDSLTFFEVEERARILTELNIAVQHKSLFFIEAKTITPGGERKWVRLIGIPLVEQDEVTMLRGALTDITKEKEDQLTLIQAKNIAEDAARSKTEFLSVMSHEIRTPLNGIIGITSLLELNHTPEQTEYIRNLSFSANHLLRLINDILDLHKVESGNLELTKAEIDLYQLIRDISNQFESLAASKHIRIIQSIAAGVPPKVLGDTLRLSQILNNLVSNAIKYTDEGEVTITLSTKEVTAGKAILHFSINDTGIGIPEDMHERIFESFRQVHQASSRKHTGTGLGLTITKKLIELHGSDIFVKSNPGKGTEFYFDLTFNLPLRQPEHMRKTPSTNIAAYQKKFAGLRVLFVEDNHINVIVASRQLEYFGIQPDCAADAFEAQDLLKERSYDVALLDLHMPEMDGYALAEIIKRDYPGIHIIIFTADIMDDVRMRLGKMGIFDVLNKPFMPEEMLNALIKAGRLKGLTS